MAEIVSENYGFLGVHDAQLVRLGALAERYFTDDPVTCLIKLRQFGEVLAQVVAAKSGLFRDPQEQQTELLRRLRFERIVPPEVADLFHHIRQAGNKATHQNEGSHAEALTSLKFGRELGIWFHRTFSPTKKISFGPFVPPRDPSAATKELSEELSRLRSELDKERSATEKARVAVEENERARLTAEERARKEAEDRTVWEQIAAEAEAAKSALTVQLQMLQAAALQAPTQAVATLVEKAEEAASGISIDEASTRVLIDEQLRARGWEANTQTIRYSAGSRPAKGRNLAIAEWPTKAGRQIMRYSLALAALES
jgi:type I restriction enzyme R subunit